MLFVLLLVLVLLGLGTLVSKMTKFPTLVAIHLRDGLPLATCEELFLLGMKIDSILVELLQHLGGSSHQEGNRCIIIVDGP